MRPMPESSEPEFLVDLPLSEDLDGYDCPVGCGKCCLHVRASFSVPWQENGYCVHSVENSCSLSKDERPALCRMYLCDDVLSKMPNEESKHWRDNMGLLLMKALAVGPLREKNDE